MSSKELEASKTFCALAWTHQFINLDGKYQLCCTSEEFHTSLCDQDGKILTVQDFPNEKDVRNSHFMKEIRLKMLSGEWNPACTRCRLTEQDGGISRRQMENKNYAELIPGLLSQTNSDGTTDAEFLSFDYRLGNICNCACRMCNPRASKKWIKDWPRVAQTWLYAKGNLPASFGKFDWYKGAKFREQFASSTKNAQHLHFAGGEPLIVPELKSLLRLCVEQGTAKRIHLSFNTNLSRLDDELGDLWRHFKSVTILASVDAYGPLNEYIRTFSNFEDVHENLKKLDLNFERWNIREVLISCTLQILNIFDLKSLYDYLRHSFTNIDPLPQLIQLYYPHHFAAENLPEASRQEIVAELKDIRRQSENFLAANPRWRHREYLLTGIDAVITQMTGKRNERAFFEFYKVNDSIDVLREVRLVDYSPRLEKLRPQSVR